MKEILKETTSAAFYTHIRTAVSHQYRTTKNAWVNGENLGRVETLYRVNAVRPMAALRYFARVHHQEVIRIRHSTCRG